MTMSSWRIPATEVRRWLTDPVILATVLAAGVVAGLLSYFAVLVAAGQTPSGTTGLQIETDAILTSSSQDADLVDMARSGIVMLVPVVAIVAGVRAAGSELSSGALLQIAVAARQLRLIFLTRALTVAAWAAVAGLVVAAASLAGTQAAIAATPELGTLSAWSGAWVLLSGAAVQAVLLALLAFSLAALSRKWIVVMVAFLVYIIVLEPVVVGLLGESGSWLPREATSALLNGDAELIPVLPTALVCLALTTLTVLWFQRDRTAR